MVQVHLEWGLEGARLAGDIAIIVDVLSFSTAVSVGCRTGARIYPFPLGETARRFADRLNFECAGKRAEGGYSLAPKTLQSLAKATQLVLPFAEWCDIIFAGAGRLCGCWLLVQCWRGGADGAGARL